MTPSEHREAMFGLCVAHITSPAENRMRERTAKEQHAAALEALRKQQDEAIPDTEDDSSLRNNMMR